MGTRSQREKVTKTSKRTRVRPREVRSRVRAWLPCPIGTIRASAELVSPRLNTSPDLMNRGIEEARSSRAILISHGTTATSIRSAFSVAFPGEPALLVGDGRRLAYRVFARQRKATADLIIEGCHQSRICAVMASALEARLLRIHDGLLPWSFDSGGLPTGDSRAATLLLKDSTPDSPASGGIGAMDL
ncbi:hypothetical protein R1flu_003870 [Riccia fluitans]|uniref:Uncharacterized protein n=1 Tax=Riccia fluitans TaxID=41844 RepID=A0ABD1YAD1_9MARC